MKAPSLAVVSLSLMALNVQAGDLTCPRNCRPGFSEEADVSTQYCLKQGLKGYPVMSGPSRTVWFNGTLEGEYVEGKKTGTWNTRDLNGKILSQAHWQDGVLHGDSVVYGAQERVLERRRFKKGMAEGTWQSFFPDGTLRLLVEFHEGRREGREIYWNERGKVAREVLNRSDRALKIRDFDANGILISEQVPVENPRRLQWSVWGTKGGKLLSGEFGEHGPEGRWRRWDEAGKLLRQAEFSAGHLVRNDGDVSVPLDAPELMVSPLPSERLQLQVDRAHSEFDYHRWSLGISGLATAAAGIVHNTSVPENSWAGYWGMAMGGIGAMVSFLVTQKENYGIGPRGYEYGLSRVRAISRGSHEDRLDRERLAQLHLDDLRKQAVTLKWFIPSYTALSSAPLIISGISQQCGACTALGAGAVVASVIPLFVRTHWERGYESLMEDERKIFEPRVSGAIGESRGVPAYAATVSWRLDP